MWGSINFVVFQSSQLQANILVRENKKDFASISEFTFKKNQIYYHIMFSGSKNLDELELKLKQHLMIRRLKKNVLKQLPPKRRQKVPFDLKFSAQTADVQKVGVGPLGLFASIWHLRCHVFFPLHDLYIFDICTQCFIISYFLLLSCLTLSLTIKGKMF